METERGVPRSKLIFAISATTILLAFIIVDFFLNKEFMRGSTTLTLFLQDMGGQVGLFLSWLVSYPLTYGPIGILFLYRLFAYSREDLYYHSFLLFTCITLYTSLKALYGRGRPFLFNSEIGT